MLRTVIIDDEPLVIEGLVTMVDWQGHGFRVCGVAEDGEKGLETIEKLKPDVVFTDVRMPGLDGLSLVKKYLDKHSEPVFFVIITGYSEFDYIKKAMDFNVVDYILKPIDSDDVHSILKRIQVEYKKRTDLEKKLNQDIKNVTRMTLNRLIDEEQKPSLVGRGKMLLDLEGGNDYTYCLTSPDLFNQVLELASYSGAVESILVKENESRNTYLVWGEKVHLSQWKEEIKNIIMSIEDQKNIFFYMTQVSNDIRLIRQSHHILDAYVKNRFYHAYPYLEIEIESTLEFSRELQVFDQDPVMGKIQITDQDRAKYKLKKLFHEVFSTRIDPDLVLMKYDIFLERIGQGIEADQIPAYPENFSDFRHNCLKLITAYLNSQANHQLSLSSENIEAYVKQHIGDDLKLKSLADIFNYNPVYIGQYFLKETGKKFRDYVLEVRIDKAKGLLLHTNESIGTIAKKVGFRDRDYFVKKFKEINGCLPGEYRNE